LEDRNPLWRNGFNVRWPWVRGEVVPSVWYRGPFKSVQVNVDDFGRNIPGDAANEPSIAIAPTDPCEMAIGWRQFDAVESPFRQSGYAYSHDRGETWTFPGSLAPGEFGSDPVLAADASGTFYYLSLGSRWPGMPGIDELRLFRSFDGGQTWPSRIQVLPQFVDKPWMVIDTTGGMGDGHVYLMGGGFFNLARSTDGGLTFVNYPIVPPTVGTLAVGFSGDVFQTGDRRAYAFLGAQDSNAGVTLAQTAILDVAVCRDDIPKLDMTGECFSPNPGGLIAQPWIATGHSGELDFVYVVESGGCPSARDLGDVVFLRSADGGHSFERPVRVNDDPYALCAIQWFQTMSVAPNGRIDVVWNDTRRYLVGNLSELFYSYSIDAGVTWSKNIPVSRVFDSHVGWPQQDKLGDYYHMISDDAAANVAYAATFNGEQDVYFLRIGDCNENGIHDSSDIANGASRDANGNTVPDECERGDFTGDIVVDYADLQMFTSCQTEPNDAPRTESRCKRGLSRPSQPVCTLGDFDSDGDVDLADFAEFQTTFDLAAARPVW